LRLLGGYRGIIHCDGYEAYKTMTRATRADALSGTLAFCWSHLRRQFVKIEREAAPAPAPVAREASPSSTQSRKHCAADLLPSAVRADKRMPSLWPQP
jgi:hypothetical protein